MCEVRVLADYKGISHIKSIPVSDAAIMIIVLLLTVFVDLLVAVAVGMVFSSLLFMKKASDLVEQGSKMETFKDFTSENCSNDEGNLKELIGENQVYIKYLNGPLFFGVSASFQDMMKAIPDDVKVVIVRMAKVPYMDQSGLYAMEEALRELHNKKVKVVFTELYGQAKNMLERISIIPELVPKELCFDTINDCEAWLKDYLKH